VLAFSAPIPAKKWVITFEGLAWEWVMGMAVEEGMMVATEMIDQERDLVRKIDYPFLSFVFTLISYRRT
jgi:hypothetical protein